MNNKLLYKEIGLIDDDLVNEASDITTIRSRQRQQTRWISIAASIILLLGAGATIFFLNNRNINDDVSEDINESSAVADKDDDKNTAGDSSDFTGFAIIAYTIEENNKEYLSANYLNETASTVMEPNVKILLARYSPLMSSVPGLPFTFNITDKSIEIDSITVSVNSGNLLLWDAQEDDGAVQDCGAEYICNIGETLYWSPLDETENSIVSNATIIVTAIKDDKEIGHQTINIIFDGNNYYAVAGEFMSA